MFVGALTLGTGSPAESVPAVSTEKTVAKFADGVVVRSAFATTYPVPVASSTRFAGTGVAAGDPSAFDSGPDEWAAKAPAGAQPVPSSGLLTVMNSEPSYALAKKPKRLYPRSRKSDESP